MVPKSWMVYMEKLTIPWMIWGYSHFRKPLDVFRTDGKSRKKKTTTSFFFPASNFGVEKASIVCTPKCCLVGGSNGLLFSMFEIPDPLISKCNYILNDTTHRCIHAYGQTDRARHAKNLIYTYKLCIIYIYTLCKIR